MTQQYLIWDLPIRIFHWLLVIVLVALWYTSDQDVGLIEIHIKLGYVALGLILFRLVWGIVGTKHARFKNFKPSLSEFKHYIVTTKTGKTPLFAGHNPAGSLMVVLIIVLFLMQAISGLFINDDVFSSGPYYGTIDSTAEIIMKYLHHNAFDLIVGLSVIHIAAIIYYLQFKKVNLIKPMFTGKKPESLVSSKDRIKNSKVWLALLVTMLVVVFVYWLVVLNAPVVEDYYY